MSEHPTALIQPTETRNAVTNNFSITVCTVNGSGSQTANTTLLRALCHMGIPVSGKNIFPSNIQGQPTWYTIRLNDAGFLARCDQPEIVVAMNPMSYLRDVESLLPGGVIFVSDEIKLPVQRTDITVYPMPVKKISREASVTPNLKEYIANMVYVGVLAQILGIDMQEIYKALEFHFKGKQKAVDANFDVAKTAAVWAAENLVKQDPYRVEARPLQKEYFVVDGNTAAALGAIFGGVQFAAWYPITPASSLSESLNEYLPLLRNEPETGKHTYAIVQAEDEIAAIGMTIGAGWSGLRAMTATSGPGLSLMTEYAGLGYYAEVPIVIWDVQRVGPSTGLPTRTAQADLTEVNFFSHGDTQYVILLPGNVQECFKFGWQAFDLAERLQMPVFVLSDLDLGMNVWMTEPFEYPDKPMDRGKILWEEDLEKLKGEWGRYLDVDGDGIPYRTLPGNKHPTSAYFARGTGHDEKARYTEDADAWERIMARIKRKYETARGLVPAPVEVKTPGARKGIIYYGSSGDAVKEAQHDLTQAGIPLDLLRVRALPFPPEVKAFIDEHQECYVVELNRDGQMHQLLTLYAPDKATSLISAAHMDGLPLTARWIFELISAREEKK